MTRNPMPRAALALLLGLGLNTGAAAASEEFLDNYRPLVADRKAHKVGDTVQVVIVESTQAESSAGTGSVSATGISAAANTSDRSESGALGLNGDARGNGQTTRSGSVRSVVTAQVIGITEEGNLVLDAKQEVVINDESQQIFISGIARPLDITPDNYIPSNRLANASIKVSGVGTVANSQRQGIVFRFLKWIRIL